MECKSKRIEVRVSGKNNLELIDYHKLNDFQGDYKKINRDNLNKLKRSILNHGIFLSKKVWEDSDGVLWTLDGHQTFKALSELDKDGYEIPSIPIEYIQADDERDAVKKLLQIDSSYGEVDLRSKWLHDNIEVDDFSDISLPGFDTDDIDKMITEIEPERVINNEDIRKGDGIEQPDDESDGSIEDKRAEKFQSKIEDLGYECEDGDIFKLGQNYLLCGDSGSVETFEKLKSKIGFNFANVDMIFYDPPFQDDLKIQQSILDSVKDLYINNLVVMTSRRVLNGLDYTAHDLAFSHDLIWDRVNPHLGANLQRPLMYHVPIDIYSKNKRKKLFNRHNEWIDRVFHLDRIPSVLRIADQKRLDKILDRGAKPLKFMQVIFATYSSNRIIDPCVGNGVSFVAGHTVGRHVLGIEIDKDMCKIAQAYFERETGIQPQKIGNIDE